MDLSWLRFDKEELSPYHEKLKALDSSLLVVPRDVQAERSLDVLYNSAENLCVGTKRYLFRSFSKSRPWPSSSQAMKTRPVGHG